MRLSLALICSVFITACGGSSEVDSSQNGSGISSINPNPPVIEGCQLFPTDSFWNTPVDGLPVHSLSSTYITSIDNYVPASTVTLHPDFGDEWNGTNLGIPFDVVPSTQVNVPIFFDEAWDESDMGDTSSCVTGNQQTGCYPIPDNVDIEGGIDRHIIMLQKGVCKLFEVYETGGSPGSWSGYSGAIWDLTKNEVRPINVTSADAAGLPILPGLIRYDEVYTDKVINHVIRVTLEQIQKAYLRPPTSHTDGNAQLDRALPPMGLQLRLKSSFDITSFDPNIQVILVAMKKYGLIVADTGGQMFVSGTHDTRWDSDVLRGLSQVKITDFEVVETAGILVDF